MLECPHSPLTSALVPRPLSHALFFRAAIVSSFGLQILAVAIFTVLFWSPVISSTLYSGKVLTPEDYADVEINTEDYATVLLKFSNGAHGSFTTNQVAAGRKNRMYFEIYGSKCSVAFDSERPNELWIGHRDGNNQIMMKDPSLLTGQARAYDSYPGGHNEGFADTSKQTILRIYQHILNFENTGHPTFKDGLRELELCEAIVRSARENKWISL